MQYPNHESRERGDEKYDNASLPTQERAEHHHKRHVAKAHRFAAERGGADQADNPHEPSTHDKAHERRE